MIQLPAGSSWRRPSVDDAEAILALAAAHTQAVVGFADVTLDDVQDELTEPGFDRERDGWLVHRDGELVGWGWAYYGGDGDIVQADVVSPDEVVAAWLWQQVLQRAASLGSKVDVALYRDDAAGRARLVYLGFGPATTFHRMRIDHASPVPYPAVPSGVEVEVGPGEERFRRALHALHQASFADHFGFTAEPFDRWLEAVEASSVHDWTQARLARVDGEPAAFLMGTDQFASDERCGYVWRVGVLPSHRGRGLASLLLRQAFALDCARGRAGTILHVDTANTTPALDLYLGLGMRPVLVLDVWRAMVVP